jgi:hypothetical protein
MDRRTYLKGVGGSAILGILGSTGSVNAQETNRESSLSVDYSFNTIESDPWALANPGDELLVGHSGHFDNNYYRYTHDGELITRRYIDAGRDGADIHSLTTIDNRLYAGVQTYSLDEGVYEEDYGTQIRISDTDGEHRQTIFTEDSPIGLTYDGSNLWMLTAYQSRLIQLDNEYRPSRAIAIDRALSDKALVNGLCYKNNTFYIYTAEEADYDEEGEYTDFALTGISDGGRIEREYTLPESISGTNGSIAPANEGFWISSNDTIYKTNVNRRPTIDVSASTQTPDVGETVRFTAEVSDPEENIESIQWQLTESVTATGRTVEYAFETEGEFDVTVEVVDAAGASSTDSLTVSVSDQEVESQMQNTEGSQSVNQSGEGVEQPSQSETSSPGFGVISAIGGIALATKYLQRDW